ncbi:hypothetical protein FQZ97_1140830 [compost metagenome]
MHQRVTCSTYSGTWPTAAPMPRSGMPWGQPKFSSMPSQPVAATSGSMVFQDSSTQGTIKDTISARSGQSCFTWVISRRLISSERSVISSILLIPNTSLLAPKCAE